MANSSANASKKMGTAKKSSKKKNKKPNKKAGRIALLVILCVLVVGMLTAAIIGGYVFFNIVSFAHGEIAINLDDYKANQNQTSFVYAYDSNNELVEMAQLHGEENRIWVDFDKMPKISETLSSALRTSVLRSIMVSIGCALSARQQDFQPAAARR